MVKYNINDLYRARITKEETPEYASASNFITKSKNEFIFEKNGNIYKEVFTGIEFSETVEDVSLANTSKALISPTPLRISYFKKEQREKGNATQSQIIPIYRTINEPRKKLVKSRAA